LTRRCRDVGHAAATLEVLSWGRCLASANAAVVKPTAATGIEMVRSNSIRLAPGASSEIDSASDR
jgi:hypothetical protein